MTVILNQDIEIKDLNEEVIVIEEGTAIYLDAERGIGYHKESDWNDGIHFELDRHEYSCVV